MKFFQKEGRCGWQGQQSELRGERAVDVAPKFQGVLLSTAICVAIFAFARQQLLQTAQIPANLQQRLALPDP